MFLVALLIALASVGLGALPYAAQGQIQREITQLLGSPSSVSVRFEQIPSWKLLLGEVEHVWVEGQGLEFEGKRVSDLSAALGPVKPGQPIPANVCAEFDKTVIGDVQLPGLPDIGLENVTMTFEPFSLKAQAVIMGFFRMPVQINGKLTVQDGHLVLTKLEGRVGEQDISLPDVPLFSPPPGWTIVTAQPHAETIQLQLRGKLTP